MTAFSSLRSVVASAVILCLTSQTVLAAPAGDPPPGEADSHAAKAIEAFGAGRYDEAVTEFSAAFTLDQNPNHLFNIGRVHEEAGNLEAAVEHYKRFVAQPGVEIDHRAAALERIDVLERAIAAQKDEQEPEPAREPVVEPRPEPAPTQPVDQVDEPASDPRKGQRNAGWALLGIGGAALVAGALTTGLTASTSSKLADENDPAERDRLVARGQKLAPTSDSLLIAGGTLALVGLIVALTALPKRGDRRTATLPFAGMGSGGIVMIHRF